MLDPKNYIASKEDFKFIEKGISLVWNPKLNFIFKDKTKISKTAIISYDSKFVYVWKEKRFIKIPHKLKINKEFQLGWRAGLESESILRCLPASIKNKTRFEIPIISGGLLKPFIELQRQKKRPDSPYTNIESYLATIIHEFAHIYWNQHKLWWFSNKKENIGYLNWALKAYTGGRLPSYTLRIPSYSGLSEIFAFCTEYSISEIFFKKHKKNLDKFYIESIENLIKIEKVKHLESEDSVLDKIAAHDLAAVFGVLLIKTNRKSWPDILLRPTLLTSNVTLLDRKD